MGGDHCRGDNPGLPRSAFGAVCVGGTFRARLLALARTAGFGCHHRKALHSGARDAGADRDSEWQWRYIYHPLAAIPPRKLECVGASGWTRCEHELQRTLLRAGSKGHACQGPLRQRTHHGTSVYQGVVVGTRPLLLPPLLFSSD